MFRRREAPTQPSIQPAPTERVTSVLGSGIVWNGSLSGSGGVRIEGAFEGEITLRGLLVIGETGRVTCEHLRANVVIVAGAVRGDITAEKVEIRSTGRVWGDVVTAAFATEEGAFLRGQIRMEDEVDIGTGISPDEEDAQIEVPGIDEPDESSNDETPADETPTDDTSTDDTSTDVPSADDTSTDVPSTEEPSLEEPSEGDQET